MVPLELANQPFPERERLRVRVVDAKDLYTLIDPEDDDRQQLCPKPAPGLAFEVERIDVLVLLGWVFRVLDRAVRAMAEPFRMLFGVGMVGRALERDVQCDRQAVLTGDSNEASEIVQGSKLRMHRLVAALLGSDRPRASRLAGFRLHAVVGALAMRAADGMDGREVEHVESHARDVRQPALDVPKSPVLT